MSLSVCDKMTRSAHTPPVIRYGRFRAAWAKARARAWTSAACLARSCERKALMEFARSVDVACAVVRCSIIKELSAFLSIEDRV